MAGGLRAGEGPGEGKPKRQRERAGDDGAEKGTLGADLARGEAGDEVSRSPDQRGAESPEDGDHG
jgi:hypothetical protein